MWIARNWRIALLAIVVLAGAAVAVFDPPWFAGLIEGFDRDRLQETVERAGPWGPALIILMMTVAVVMSPIPSAPIALAAGAAYGHLWGTLYVLIGAETGALIAFALARVLGRETLRRWFGDRIDAGLLGSQNVLMWMVFVSRLMPFVSFDLISYAAGLSAIRPWRFALATLAGIVPASFLLAHLGVQAVAAESGVGRWIVLALGLGTGLPVLWAALRKRTGRERGPEG
jgi:uncharacterized membrane protein YdjX (TVP38/TMEM64 family)